MVLPIYAYGHSVLREKGIEIDANYPDLQQFIDDMFETMYASSGVGLAAQQVGKAIRLFVIDASPFAEDEGYEYLEGFKKVFINPTITNETGEEWEFNEGCLSFPELRFNVSRKSKITITYFDRDFKKHTETFDGLAARIVQHEYDHIEGILFIDRISGLKRRMLTKKLDNITKGMVKTGYKVKFPKLK